MKTLFLAIILILPFYVQAFDDVYVQAGVGFGEMEVKPDYQINQNQEDNASLDFQLMVGRMFDNKLNLDVGIMSHTAWNFFGLPVTDESDLYETMLRLGYVIHKHNELKIIPKLGYAYWELHSSEGMFLNPGPEAQETLYGSDMNVGVTVFYNKLYLSYQRAQYEFGPSNSVVFGFGFGL